MTTPGLPSAPAAAASRVAAGPTVSVLMSTYGRETAANLAAALASLRGQTRPAQEIVLVVDGPVDEGQEAVIRAFAADPGAAFKVLRLPENQGLARALNAGLAACSGAVIMRMDSDDLCLPDRIAVEADYLAAHPEIDVLSAWTEEFFEDGSPSKLKACSANHEAIVEALRWRNIIVHPAAAIRTATLRRVGGYRAKYGMLEDYDLWIRLALAGARFHVIPKVLVRMRSSLAQRRRRGGWRYTLHELRFRTEVYRAGFLGTGQFILITCLYTVFRLVSGPLRLRFYAMTRA